jgi:predicted RNA-binding Zn-ribbon protein involved in translation (DUF1610 family)
MSPRRQPLAVRAPAIHCPACHASISWQKTIGGPEFVCPSCGQGLAFRGGYFRLLYVLGIVFMTATAYAAGMRNDALIAIVLLGIWPTYLLLLAINFWLFAPDVETTGEFRGILYGAERNPADPESPSSVTDRNDLAVKWSERSPAAVTSTPTLFALHEEPRTFEGGALRIAVVLLVVSTMWTAARPLVFRIAPEFGATKQGPPQFPVRIHIGDQTMTIFNGSTEGWTCQAEFGFFQEYRSAFAVEPSDTHTLMFREVAGADGRPDLVRDAARGLVRIDCSARTGHDHYWEFR